MLNIEFKAELRERELARGVLKTLGALFQGKFEQTDVFVRVPEGRLKRREHPGEPACWIWYQRSDEVGVRESHWTRLDAQQIETRFAGLDRTPWKRVVKRRELWTLENVRVHLDEVLGVGSFLEFEGVVAQGTDAAETRMKVEHLVAEFRPLLGEPIASSYESLVEPLGIL